MDQKLPGYNQAKQLYELYQKAGFNHEQISRRLKLIEEMVLLELANDLVKALAPGPKAQYEALLQQETVNLGEIIKLLNVDKDTISAKLELKLKELIDQFSMEIARAELSLQQLSSIPQNPSK